MADIDVNAGLAVKADVNKLYGDVAGTVAKFKEDRRFNKESYESLLDKYASTITDIEYIRNKLNDLIEDAQSNKLPDENDVKAINAFAGLVGAKNQDGSINLQKLFELKEVFGNKKELV